MTPEEKIEIVSKSPEIQSAVKLLIGLMENIGAKDYVKMDFVLSAPGIGDFSDDSFTLSLHRETKESANSNASCGELPSDDELRNRSKLYASFDENHKLRQGDWLTGACDFRNQYDADLLADRDKKIEITLNQNAKLKEENKNLKDVISHGISAAKQTMKQYDSSHKGSNESSKSSINENLTKTQKKVISLLNKIDELAKSTDFSAELFGASGQLMLLRNATDEESVIEDKTVTITKSRIIWKGKNIVGDGGDPDFR